MSDLPECQCHEEARMWRNLVALLPYAIRVMRVPIPQPRPAHADTVPLFPRRQKARGHL